MKKYLSLLIVFLTIQAFGQKGVIIPTKPNPQPAQSKPKPSSSTSSSTSSGAEIWKIDAATVACNSGQCMLVKKQGQQDFEIFEDKIDGFEYTEGESYTLQVKKTLKAPPIQANESIYKYELVKIISTSDAKYQTAQAVAPSNAGTLVSIDIDYGTIPCESGSEKQCFLVKEKNQKEYEIFNGCVYGFTFEGGYRYTLQVKRNGFDYDLVKVVKKEFVEHNPTKISCTNQRNNTTPAYGTIPAQKFEPKSSINTSSALDKKWYLRKMKEDANNSESFVTDDNYIWIEITSFNDRLKGFGSCNSFEAVVQSDLNTSFKVSKLTTTLKNCGYIKLESKFHKALQDADRFEIRDGNLILSKQWKYLMEFTSNPNQKEDSNASQNYQPQESSSQNKNAYSPSHGYENKTVQSSQSDNFASNSSSKEMEDLQKELQELKKQLAAKKESEAEAIKKLEQEKLQQQKEAELLKQQLAEIELQRQEEAQRLKLEQEKLKTQKEIDEMKKQLAEKEKSLTSYPLVENKSETKKSANNDRLTETPSSNYKITEFKKNYENNFGNIEFASRPYFLDGNELISFERVDATFDIKNKLYAGVDMFYTAFKPESSIQFKKGSIPRVIIKIEDGVDPNDILQLSKAIELKDRRRFQTGSMKMTGKTKDVSQTRLSLDFKKVSTNIYEIILPDNLEIGEYGFLPISSGNQSISPLLGNSSSSTKINCFGVAP